MAQLSPLKSKEELQRNLNPSIALLIYRSLYCFAMASKDTPGEEFNSLKDACKSDNAKVHGLVSSLNPMKKGKSAHFFDGKICDQDKEMRIVGFQQSQRKRLADFQSSSDPISFANCTIKKARQSDDLEIILKASTKLTKSPPKISL